MIYLPEMLARVVLPRVVFQVALLRLEVPLCVGKRDPVAACWDSTYNINFSKVLYISYSLLASVQADNLGLPNKEGSDIKPIDCWCMTIARLSSV